jgi:hypothetical protein
MGCSGSHHAKQTEKAARLRCFLSTKSKQQKQQQQQEQQQQQ